MFEGSHIPLRKWVVAIHMFLAHKKGIGSAQLHKDVVVIQNTAWLMLSRIRYNLRNIKYIIYGDVMQVSLADLTKRQMGMLSNGRVYTEVIPKASKWILQHTINTFIPKGSIVVTDGYKGLSENYEHKVVDHHRGEYVKRGYHTNSIESFGSQLKRGIVGVCHLVSKKHLELYCDEFACRYNLIVEDTSKQVVVTNRVFSFSISPLFEWDT